MGTKGREIVKDVDKILTMLNKAYSDEWLAYYQYWIGAKIAAGPMKDALVAELLEHAADELRHAEMVADRIIQLGGTPVVEPKEWYTQTNCGYEAPTDPYVVKIVEQNIRGEQCAIGVYNSFQEIARDLDPVSYQIVVQILGEEVEHEEDLQSLLEDYQFIMAKK